MALTSKKYTRIYSSDGSDSDKIDSDKIAKLESDFNSNSYLKAFGQFDMLAPVLHILQKLTEEIDYLRTEIELNKDKTGISTSQASAITANTAKAGITTQQAATITDNKDEVKRLGGLITTNTNDIKSQGNSVNLLTVNKLEVTPDLNSSNNQRLVCGIVQNRGTYGLDFTFTDIDKNGKKIEKTGSIQLK